MRPHADPQLTSLARRSGLNNNIPCRKGIPFKASRGLCVAPCALVPEITSAFVSRSRFGTTIRWRLRLDSRANPNGMFKKTGNNQFRSQVLGNIYGQTPFSLTLLDLHSRMPKRTSSQSLRMADRVHNNMTHLLNRDPDETTIEPFASSFGKRVWLLRRIKKRLTSKSFSRSKI